MILPVSLFDYLVLQSNGLQKSTCLFLTLYRIRGVYILPNHKCVQWICTIIQNTSFTVSYAINLIYKDIQPIIETIRLNHITSNVKYIMVPIKYVHKQYALLSIEPVNMKTINEPNETGTKKFNGPLLEHHHFYILVAIYYLPLDSDHYQHLSLDSICYIYRPTAL